MASSSSGDEVIEIPEPRRRQSPELEIVAPPVRLEMDDVGAIVEVLDDSADSDDSRVTLDTDDDIYNYSSFRIHPRVRRAAREIDSDESRFMEFTSDEEEEEEENGSSDIADNDAVPPIAPAVNQPREGPEAPAAAVETAAAPVNIVPENVTPENAATENTGPENAAPNPPTQSATESTSTSSQQNTSASEFKSPRRPRIPTPKKTTPGKQEDNDDDEGQSCSICFEEWTGSGLHRLVSLKCGHLFGKSCIEKWLKGQGNKCPQCNTKAVRKDIRPVYAKSLKMVDTTERDAALQQLAEAQAAKQRAEVEAAQIRLRYDLALTEVTKLKAELERQHQRYEQMRLAPASSRDVPASQSTNSRAGRFEFDRLIKLSDNGGCRVMDYNASIACLCVSCPSSNPLFPGFGIKKINTLDLRSIQYVSLHTKPIRDLAFHPTHPDPLLLSASMDKTVKVTHCHSNSTVISFTSSHPVWSCAWNEDDRNYFFAGHQNGSVTLYDMRNTQSAVDTYNTEGSRSPAVSLAYLPISPSVGLLKPGGLVIAQLDRSSFLEKLGSNYKQHTLPLEGNLTSLHADSQSRHLLATYRPTARSPAVRHQLYELSASLEDGRVTCNSIHTFHGGSTQKILARNRLLPAPTPARTPTPTPAPSMLVCASDEATQAVQLWDTGTSRPLQKILCKSTVLDVCPLRATSEDSACLALLTDKELAVHQWIA